MTEAFQHYIATQAAQLASDARKHGLVLTVEQIQRGPSMGDHFDRITLRPELSVVRHSQWMNMKLTPPIVIDLPPHKP